MGAITLQSRPSAVSTEAEAELAQAASVEFLALAQDRAKLAELARDIADESQAQGQTDVLVAASQGLVVSEAIATEQAAFGIGVAAYLVTKVAAGDARMTGKEFAERIGKSEAYVSQLSKVGVLYLTGSVPEGMTLARLVSASTRKGIGPKLAEAAGKNTEKQRQTAVAKAVREAEKIRKEAAGTREPEAEKVQAILDAIRAGRSDVGKLFGTLSQASRDELVSFATLIGKCVGEATAPAPAAKK